MMVKYAANNRSEAFLFCLFALIISLSLCGCGGSFRSFPGEGDVSGSWNLVLTPTGASALAAKLCTLDQTDHNISGTTSDGGTITGTVSGKNIDLTINNAGGTTTTLAGTVDGDWKTMSGTYTSTGPDGSGNWSATKNIPLAPLSVTPTTATLSCTGTTGSASQTFTATGGTRSKYSVTASTNTSLITLSTTTLTTNGQFTVTANNTCGASGSVVNLAVTDTTTTVNLTVTITNP